VAISLLSILHAIPDADDPYSIVAMLLDAVPSGSYLAISQFGQELLPAEAREALMDSIRRTSLQQYTSRTREQVARFFDGTDLVEPGLVPVEEWRPDPGADGEGKSLYWCAVGHKH
jgi:S-adenosyl methyltransferase